MKIPHPFIVRILNKMEVHPLQAASNQSGEKLMEIAGANEFNPPKRSAVVVANELILPAAGSPLYNNLPEYLQFKKMPRPEAVRNSRNTLWLKVSWRETRKAAQFCRQFELALPPDIELDSAKRALSEFAQNQLVSQGMIADLAIHESQIHGATTAEVVTCDRTGYLMCTTRPFINGEFVNKTRSWNDRSQLLEWRKAWFDILARYLPPADQEGLSQNSKDLSKFCTRFATKTTDGQPRPASRETAQQPTVAEAEFDLDQPVARSRPRL